MKRSVLFLLMVSAVLLALAQRITLAEGAHLSVVYCSPEGEMKRPDDGVLVMFDRPMVALAPATRRAEGPLQLDPPQTGAYRWLGTRTLAFYPERLARATTFTAVVPAGTRALDGATLQNDYRFTFSTERPELQASMPHESARLGVPPARILLRFDLPMDPERAAAAIHLSEGDKPGPAVRVRPLQDGDLPKSAEGEEEDAQEWPADRTLVVDPQAPLHRDVDYTVELDAGLRAREGNLGLEEARRISFSVVGPLHFLGLRSKMPHDPDDAIPLEFNNEVRPSDLSRHVKLTPPAPVEDTQYAYGELQPSVSVGMRPATRYRLTIDGALQDVYGNRLGRDVTVDLKTADRKPLVVAPLGPRTLEAYLAPQLPVGFVNVPGLRLVGARAHRATVVPLLVKYDQASWRPGPALFDRTWRPGAKANQLTFMPLDLSRHLDNGYGMLAIRLQPSKGEILNLGGGYGTSAASVFVQATRMGLTGKFAPDATLLWVTDLEDSRALPGTDVELRDNANRVRWRGRTDGDGLVSAPGWHKLGLADDDTLYAIASRGRDMAVLSSDWSSTVWPGAFRVYRGNQSSDELEAVVFTDRGLYRPGDTLHLKAVVRARKADNWVVAGGRRVSLAIHDSRGETLVTRGLKLSATGALDHTLTLPPGASTGRYRIALAAGKRTCGEGDFRVEAYRPAQFEVKVAPESHDAFYGQKLQARISGSYLFGAAMPSAPVKWSVFAAPTGFTPSHWEGVAFGPDPWLSWSEDPAESEALQHRVETQLDEKGATVATLTLRPRALTGPAQVTLQATVTDADKTELSGSALIHLHPAEVYVGLRPDSTFVAENSPLGCKVVVVRPDGTSVAGRKVKLELLKREYKSVRRYRDGAMRWVSTPTDVVVKSAEVDSADREVPVRIATAGPGLYVLRGRSTDDAGRQAETTTGVFAYGGGAAAWERKDDRLELTPDRRAYRVGDVARVAISSPFPKARALVTVERDGILERFVSDVTGGAPVVRIPLRHDHAPNVYVSVALIRGRTGRNRFGPAGEDLARPAFRMGYVKLAVDPSGHRLKVDVKPDRERYGPGDTVTVDLQVRDAAGHARPGEVTFVAADMGVLNLIDYHLPDPLATFFRERGLSVETCETRHHVIGQHRYGEKGRPGGGGGPPGPTVDASGSYRWNFEATPCWRPSVATDEQGRARVTFKLPDSTTAFRLSAVACAGDSDFGRAESEIRVSRPLTLTPSWPRFCLVGDDATAGVIVHNGTGAAGTAKVSVQAEGADIVGTPSQDVQLATGASQVVRFDLRTPRTGQARLRFNVQMGEHKDGLQAAIPIHMPRLTEAAAMRESTEGSFAVPLQVPADVIPGSARLQVTLASSALAGLQPAVEYLRAYRHECLEQKVSRVLPTVEAHDVVSAFGREPAQARKQVQEVLDVLASLQHASGGLGLWGPREPSPWATAYAMQLSALARKQGYRVDERTSQKALAYLTALLAAGDDDERWVWRYSERERLAVKAYMLAVLKMWGREDRATLNVLYERRSRLPACGQAWLLRAMTGHGPESDTIARLLLNRLHVDPAQAHFEDHVSDLYWIYESPTRLNALALQALLESGHDFPQAPDVVRWLVLRRKDGRWRTTQENASVFGALSAWYRTHEKVTPDFVATVRVAGREAVRQTFRGRHLDVVSRSVDLPVGNVPMQVSREGSGTLFLSALLRYASRAMGEPAEAGLSVVKFVDVMEGRSNGEGTYAPGTLLRVRLVVSNPTWRPYVVVDDPVGGGMEVVQTTFATERVDLLQGEEDDRHEWGGFNQMEIYDDRVMLFAYELTPGVHQYSYYVRAAFPGRYAVSATHAEAMYEPEVFGRTAPSQVTIR